MLAQVSGKKLKRGKAKEDFGQTGSAADLAETMPVDSLPADSQDPLAEFPDSQPAFPDSQPMDVGGGVEREDGEEGDKNGEGAEEEKLTDDELVEPVVCHEHCEYTDTSPAESVDPPAPRKGGTVKNEVEAKGVKGSGVVAAAADKLLTAGSADGRAAAQSGAGDVPASPPPSPSKHVVDLASDDEHPKNQNKDAIENVKTKEAQAKGTWKDGPSTKVPY